mmetsp:Transcript_13675/g.20066  ORF Transcript_13675/g.20066 Transcript_13675/m.20066 type:complete len:240 (-) Transcript_13675:363-1082(-)
MATMRSQSRIMTISYTTKRFQLLCLLLPLLFHDRATPINAFTPVDTIRRDFLALTRKVTTHHILLPKTSAEGYEAALLLKQKIRNKVNDRNAFVVDVFSSAAKKFSIDLETAERGGLIGELVPQGYSICPELDRASFEVPLGEVSGPIESKYGYHLVLVCERINCPKLDGTLTRVIRGEDGLGTMLAPSTAEGQKSMGQTVLEVSMQQIGFWIVIFLAGGVLAEMSAKAAGILDTVPWE